MIHKKITVEVVYAFPNKQYTKLVYLNHGATVKQAIISSGLLELRKDINIYKNKIGIYSNLVNLTDIVKDGDRVEIYRPLIANPNELRRKSINKLLKRNNLKFKKFNKIE